MQQALLDHLRIITDEEQRILDGVAEVDKDLYTSGKDFTVDSAKSLMENMRLRFILPAVMSQRGSIIIQPMKTTRSVLSICTEKIWMAML